MKLTCQAAVACAASFTMLCLQAGRANAGVYAFADNLISDFEISVDSGSLTLLGGVDRTNTNQTTFDNLPGSNGSHSNTTVAPQPTDTLESWSGPNAGVVGQNVYTYQAGKAAGLVGARADSNTGSGNPFVANGGTVVGGGSGTSTMNTVAEALTNPSDAATSDGRGTNVGQFLVGPGGVTLHISFNDVVALFASSANTGEVSQATVGNDFEITGPTSFSYVPTEVNLTQSSLNGFNTIDYEPSMFSLSSDEVNLAPGTYNFARRNESQVNLQAVPPVSVPEPISIAGFGAGAAGIVWLRRRPRSRQG